ncbi:MAG: hypothetical protein U5K54_15100 [Cytophagales bacterium]|nr:hypothetical protein [Cytophagales bacterium]
MIVPLIGARQDTLVANTFFYIGDSYRNDYKIEEALTYFLKNGFCVSLYFLFIWKGIAILLII